jgi:hypothetical protein
VQPQGKQSPCCALLQTVSGADSEAMAGGAGKRSKQQRARTGTKLSRHTLGREGGSGSGMRGGRGMHWAARFLIWPSQQVMRELPESGVGGKRTRSGRMWKGGKTVEFITSSGSMGLDWRRISACPCAVETRW